MLRLLLLGGAPKGKQLLLRVFPQRLVRALLHQADTVLASISWIAVALYAVLVVLLHLKPLKKLHPIVFIAVGAVAGILLQM